MALEMGAVTFFSWSHSEIALRAEGSDYGAGEASNHCNGDANDKKCAGKGNMQGREVKSALVFSSSVDFTENFTNGSGQTGVCSDYLSFFQ
jgi:hypothetical protein